MRYDPPASLIDGALKESEARSSALVAAADSDEPTIFRT